MNHHYANKKLTLIVQVMICLTTKPVKAGSDGGHGSVNLLR